MAKDAAGQMVELGFEIETQMTRLAKQLLEDPARARLLKGLRRPVAKRPAPL